ncbi:MAG: FkbM family methyltransferase [Parvularculaceae bacterium]
MTPLETVRDLLAMQSPARGATIIDGGAHHGAFARKALEIFDGARILAFEPDPDSFSKAQTALAERKTVEIVNAALGAKPGRAEFFRGAFSATNSLLARPAGAGKPYFPPGAALASGGDVAVTTIDSECARRGISTLDLLKLDLQGGELDALNGASALLERGGAAIVLCEVVFVEKYERQPLFWRIWEALAKYGYSFFSLEDLKIGLYHDEAPGMRQRQWNQADAIFLSPSLRRSLDR